MYKRKQLIYGEIVHVFFYDEDGNIALEPYIRGIEERIIIFLLISSFELYLSK
jgi:hypothetical protein